MSTALSLVDSLISNISTFIATNTVSTRPQHPTMNQLEQLSAMTIVVADTGDLDAIKEHKPTDSTTNPSLVLKALKALHSDDEKADNTEYNALLKLAVDYAKAKAKANTLSLTDQLALALDRLSVEFGVRILQCIPGYVSTELDARLSFDIDGSVARAVSIMAMYEELGVSDAKDRVLIKVATTWEGVQIARRLREGHDIKCNMTLLFSVYQAAAAAHIAKAFLISPFVGRITDWYKKAQGKESFDAFKDDPGVQSVRDIYGYYKRFGCATIVMGASFRNKEQILALAGCDRLTIGPKWLEKLRESKEEVQRQLEDKGAESETRFVKKMDAMTESEFRFGMCCDPMATEKLAEGIRKFAADIVKVEEILKPLFE